jgi:hypothetical protein
MRPQRVIPDDKCRSGLSHPAVRCYRPPTTGGHESAINNLSPFAERPAEAGLLD